MEGRDELNAFQVLEVRSSLPDELLMYADKLSMAHGLEVRVPYLDREVIECAASIPAERKVRLGRRKWLHREVCRRFLPRTILARKKRGFAVDVVDAWLRRTGSDDIGRYLLDGSALIYGFLDHHAVRRLADQHQRGARDNHKLLFSLIVLEQWLRGQSTHRRTASVDAPALALSA